jgi:hypothetical protein
VWRHGVGGDDPAALAELVGAEGSLATTFVQARAKNTYTANSS